MFDAIHSFVLFSDGKQSRFFFIGGLLNENNQRTIISSIVHRSSKIEKGDDVERTNYKLFLHPY